MHVVDWLTATLCGAQVNVVEVRRPCAATGVIASQEMPSLSGRFGIVIGLPAVFVAVATGITAEGPSNPSVLET